MTRINRLRSTTIIARHDPLATSATLPTWTWTRTRPTRPRSTRNSTAIRRPSRRRTSRASATSAWGRSTPAAARRLLTGRTRAARESPEPTTDSRVRTHRCRRPRPMVTRRSRQTGKLDSWLWWRRRMRKWNDRCLWLRNTETFIISCLRCSRYLDVLDVGRKIRCCSYDEVFTCGVTLDSVSQFTQDVPFYN